MEIWLQKATLIKITPEAYSEQSQKFNTEFLTKILPDWMPFKIFAKKVSFRCFAGFWIPDYTLFNF